MIQYAYDGADIIQEFGATQADYVRTLNVDEPLTKADGTNAYHYIRDGLGSVAALVDDTGVTAASYTYDPYGVTTALGTISNPFQFTGRENDGDLYFYRARYYSPEMQRFISRDPLQFSAGSPNFYGYVGQNPVNFTDPEGELSHIAAGALVGGALGLVGTLGTDLLGGIADPAHFKFSSIGTYLGNTAGGAITGGLLMINPVAAGVIGNGAGSLIGSAIDGDCMKKTAKKLFLNSISGAVGGKAGSYLSASFPKTSLPFWEAVFGKQTTIPLWGANSLSTLTQTPIQIIFNSHI